MNRIIGLLLLVLLLPVVAMAQIDSVPKLKQFAKQFNCSRWEFRSAKKGAPVQDKAKEVDTLKVVEAGWPDTITIVVSDREEYLRRNASGGDFNPRNYTVPQQRGDGKWVRYVNVHRVGPDVFKLPEDSLAKKRRKF